MSFRRSLISHATLHCRHFALESGLRHAQRATIDDAAYFHTRVAARHAMLRCHSYAIATTPLIIITPRDATMLF